MTGQAQPPGNGINLLRCAGPVQLETNTSYLREFSADNSRVSRSSDNPPAGCSK
jgi:hypothetical protein